MLVQRVCSPQVLPAPPPRSSTHLCLLAIQIKESDYSRRANNATTWLARSTRFALEEEEKERKESGRKAEEGKTQFLAGCARMQLSRNVCNPRRLIKPQVHTHTHTLSPRVHAVKRMAHLVSQYRRYRYLQPVVVENYRVSKLRAIGCTNKF